MPEETLDNNSQNEAGQASQNAQNLVQVEVYANEMDAQLAQTTLRAAGIDSVMMRDGADGMLQFLDFVEGIRLLVNAEQAEEAKTILEQQASTETETTEQ